MDAPSYFRQAWSRYAEVCPEAQRIQDLLRAKGESPLNDHIALRTFGLPGMDRFALGRVFEAWGYRMADDLLEFPEKKLLANYWLHPERGEWPKIFISELRMDLVSAELRAWIEGVTLSLRARATPISADDLMGSNWAPVALADYRRWYPKSEYAAWTAAFGLRPNHFTVLVNSLQAFPTLQALNDFLVAAGVRLSPAGGVIKGTPEERLEQSATLAQEIPWEFAAGERAAVQGCYHEFARRYAMPDGKLFEGFVPKSADKIFESNLGGR